MPARADEGLPSRLTCLAALTGALQVCDYAGQKQACLRSGLHGAMTDVMTVVDTVEVNLAHSFIGLGEGFLE